MATACEKLERFVDGELPPADADTFREHLVGCASCETRLEDLMHLQTLAARHAQRPVPVQASWWSRVSGWWSEAARWPILAVPGGLAVAAGLMVAISLAWEPAVDDSVYAPGGMARLAEGRSAYAQAMRHLPPAQRTLSSGGGAPKLPHDQMARLEKREDGAFALAAAYLAHGDPALADLALEQMKGLAEGADHDSERALAHLVRADRTRGDLEEALRLAERALRANPRHGPALWNKALALQELKLTMLAARTFEEVAQLGEPGWAEEARARAEQLRREASLQHERWRGALKAGGAFVAGTPPPPAARQVAIFRLYFYDAVRARASAEEVQALGQVAAELDALSGGSALQGYVRWVAGRDFAVRGPLASRYQRLVAMPDPGQQREAAQALVRDLQGKGEDDLLTGAILYAGGEAAGEDVRLCEWWARTFQDPWFESMALQRRGAALERSGALGEARAVLEQAARVARDARLNYRYLHAVVQLTTVLLRVSEPDESYARATDAWSATEGAGDWGRQVQLIQQLAQLARLRQDYPLTRAYLEEAVERTREDRDLAQERFMHENLALLEINRLDGAAARRHMDAAIAAATAARLPLTTSGALTLAEVARLKPSAQDRQAMDAFRAALSGLRRGEQALARHALARWTIELDPEEGRGELRQVIEEARPLAADNQDAARAVAYSYASLIMDAAKRNDFAAVLTLFAEEEGTAFPDRCAVALGVDGERSVVASRGAAGELDGELVGARQAPLGSSLEGLVPARMVAALKGCAEVKVLARAPLYGRAGALPVELAWSYLLPGDRPPAAPGAQQGGTHLVVQGAAFSDRRKHLSTPARWLPRSPGSAELVVLEGRAATPSAVLRLLPSAEAVDVVTHGLVNHVSDEAYLVLAEEAGGDQLRASQILGVRFSARPVVVLAACGAAHPAPSVYQRRSLPAAFLQAGARAVLAASGDIPDREGPEFFEAVRARIQAGERPAAALRDERQAWLGRGGGAWLRSVLLFE